MVGEFSDGQACIDFVRENDIDLVILDLGITGGMQGLEAGPLIREIRPAIKIMVLSQFGNYYPKVEPWANGYLLKREAPAKFLTAIEEILGGVSYVSDEVRAAADPATIALFNSLRPSEQTVVQLVLRNKSSQEIAEELDLSTLTISKHLQNTYNKLGLKGESRSKAGLIRMARTAGIIHPHP